MCPFSGTQPLVSRVLAEKLRILPPSASNFPPCVVETHPKISFTFFQSFFLRLLTRIVCPLTSLPRFSSPYLGLRGINLRLECFLSYLVWEFLNRIIWCYKKRFRPFVAIVRANLLNVTWSVLRNVLFISSPGKLFDMLIWVVYRVF